MWQHDKDDKTQTYQYHLDTYGKDVNYDDFAANFTGKKFDPKEWVDLFADAGAQYFVPTTSTSTPRHPFSHRHITNRKPLTARAPRWLRAL